MSPTPHFIQIQSHASGADTSARIYGLTADGEVFVWDPIERQWVQLKNKGDA